jgi:hypothetical protein
MSDTGILMGHVDVFTSSHGGHPPEFFADRIVEKLILVGDNLPEPIRGQAIAYRDDIRTIVLAGLQAALASDRAYRT